MINYPFFRRLVTGYGPVMAAISEAITQGFWFMVWQSPLQKEMSDIRMQDLNKTALGNFGTFGVVKKLTDESKKAVYAGRILPEDGLINTDVVTSSTNARSLLPRQY